MSLSISPVSANAQPSTQEPAAPPPFLRRAGALWPTSTQRSVPIEHALYETYDAQVDETQTNASQVKTPAPKRGALQTMDMRNDIVGNWGRAGEKAVQAAEELFFGAGNSNLSAQDIHGGIHTLMAATDALYANHSPEYRQNKIIDALIEAALHYDVSAQQMADAMAGEAGFSRSEIDQTLNAKGLMPPSMWQSIVDASVISVVRARLNGSGMDGRGVIVRVQEPSNTTHGALVSSVVADPQFGVAPGATIERGFVSDLPGLPSGPALSLEEEFWLEVEKTGLPSADPQTLRVALKNLLTNSAVLTLDQQTATVQDLVAHSAARVVNMSYGTSLALFYGVAADVIDRVPALKQAVLGSTSDSGDLPRTSAFTPAVTAITDEALLSNTAVQQAFGRYVSATQTAADSGKVLVVAAGNSQRAMDAAQKAGLALPDWAGFNLLAASDYVIAVGASSTQGTPAQVADDTITDFSSQGGSLFHPTLATQGTQIPVNYPTYIAWLAQPMSNLSGQGISGTSFSAPIVSGAAALLLQQNSNLTFAEVKDKLQSAVVDTAAPFAAEGTGMLDVVQAVLV